MDTERQLRAVTEDLVRTRKQRDYDFLARVAAAGQMHELQTQRLQEMVGGDTQHAMQVLSAGMAMTAEGWRVPETQLRYGDMLADFEAMGGAQHPEQMQALRDQFERSRSLGTALTTDQEILERKMNSIVGFNRNERGRAVTGNLLESFLASASFGALGEVGDRQSRLVSSLVEEAGKIAHLRYAPHPHSPESWSEEVLSGMGFPEPFPPQIDAIPVQGIADEKEYQRMLTRSVVADLRKKAMKHPDLKASGGEAFGNEVANLAGMLLPIGAVAEGVGNLVGHVIAKTGLRRTLARALGRAGARVVGGTMKLGAEAGALGALGAAMPEDSSQKAWLSIDVEQRIKDSGLQGEAADKARAAAKAAVSFQNAMSMGVMVPAMAIAGPIAAMAGKGAGTVAAKIAGSRSAWAMERVGAGMGIGASMPAVMEFASAASERVAKAAEGSEGLFEALGQASQMGLIAEGDSVKPVQSFFVAAAAADVTGMKLAFDEYVHRAAAPMATLGAMQLLGLVRTYAGTRLRGNDLKKWNQFVDVTGRQAKLELGNELPEEMKEGLADQGVPPGDFQRAAEDLVDAQVSDLRLEEPAITEAEQVRAEPGGAQAIGEDVAVRATDESAGPTVRTEADDGHPREIGQAIEDTHRAEDAVEDEIRVATEDAGEASAATAARQGLVRTERRVLALERQARNLDISQPARERAAQMAAELRSHLREQRDWIEGGAHAGLEPPAPDLAPRGGLAREVAQGLAQGARTEEQSAKRIRGRRTSASAMLEDTNRAFREQAERINQAADLARRDDAEPGERQAATRVATEGRVALKRWVGELQPGTRLIDALGTRWTLLDPTPNHGEGVWRAVDERGRVVEKWDPDEWILGAPERVEFHSPLPKRELQRLRNDVTRARQVDTPPVNAPAADVRAEELRSELDRVGAEHSAAADGSTKRELEQHMGELAEELQKETGELDPNDTSIEDAESARLRDEVKALPASTLARIRRTKEYRARRADMAAMRKRMFEGYTGAPGHHTKFWSAHYKAQADLDRWTLEAAQSLNSPAEVLKRGERAEKTKKRRASESSATAIEQRIESQKASIAATEALLKRVPPKSARAMSLQGVLKTQRDTLESLNESLQALSRQSGPPQDAQPDDVAVVASEVIGKAGVADIIEADAAKGGRASQKERAKRRQAGEEKASELDSESAKGSGKRRKDLVSGYPDQPINQPGTREAMHWFRDLRATAQRAIWDIVDDGPVVEQWRSNPDGVLFSGAKYDRYMKALNLADLLDVAQTTKANGPIFRADLREHLLNLAKVRGRASQASVLWDLDEQAKPVKASAPYDPNESSEKIIKTAAWKFVVPAVAKDETRYAINGTLVDGEKGVLVGTDGRRLHVIRVGPHVGKRRVLALDGVRELDSRFPEWDQVIPKSPKVTRHAAADLVRFAESIPNVSRPEGLPATIAFLRTTKAGTKRWVQVAAEYISDAARGFLSIGVQEVDLHFSDQQEPILLRSPDGSAQVVIMPISADTKARVFDPGVAHWIDGSVIRNLDESLPTPKSVAALPRPTGPFEIPASLPEWLAVMQRTSDRIAQLAADLIEDGILNDHRVFAEKLWEDAHNNGLIDDEQIRDMLGGIRPPKNGPVTLAWLVDIVGEWEASAAATKAPSHYASFLNRIRKAVLHGSLGALMQYWQAGSRLIGRIVRNTKKFIEGPPGNPEAGALNIGAILDIPGAIWGHVRKLFGDIWKPRVVEGLVAEMESAPRDRLGTVRRFLAERGMLPPQSFAGFIARDGIRAIEEGVGAVEQYRRQVFGAGGLLDGIEEGSEPSKRIFAALGSPYTTIENQLDGTAIVQVEVPHPAWEALQGNEKDIARKLRDLFEEFRVHLASVHPRAVRLADEATYTRGELREIEAEHSRLKTERDLAKALWETLPSAQEYTQLRAEERETRSRAKSENVHYETPRAFAEQLADLYETAMREMRDAGYRGGPASYNGILSQLSRKKNMLMRRLTSLDDAHAAILEGYGLRNYVHHVISPDAGLDDLRELFSGPVLRSGGPRDRRQGWSDAQLRLDRRHAARAGIGATRTGKLEQSGLLAEDVVRSVWDYIHTFPVYLKRLEFMARYDRFLNGGLEPARSIQDENGKWTGHEAFMPHSEVIYGATAARSFGRMVAMFDSEGNVSFHRWHALTDKQREQIAASRAENSEFRARQRILGLDPGPSEQRMDRVILWLGSEDPLVAPTWDRLADPGWVATHMRSEGDDVGPTRVPLLLALELKEAKDRLRLWRNGWYGRVLEVADRARDMGDNPRDFRAAAENLSRYIDEQILGASAEASTGLMHEFGPDGLQAASNARQVFERVGSMIAAGLSAHAIGGPTNLRNALQDGGGGLVLAYSAMGRLPSLEAISAMRRYGRAQAIMKGLEQGFWKKMGRAVRLGFGGRDMPDLQTVAQNVGGWKHLNEAIETMELTSPAKLASMSPEARARRKHADEAIREALRLNLTGGNRGDQIGRMLDWTTQWLRGSGPLRKRSFDVRRGEIVREGRLSLTNIFRRFSDVFWSPFNLGERYARVMPFIEQYVAARKEGAGRGQAANRAFDFMQQAQLVYSRAAKMRAWNHPILRMLSALTTWAAHAETRFGLVLGGMGPLSLGSRLGLWSRLAAVVFIGWQLGVDMTRMTMSAASDLAGVGQAVVGLAGGVVPTESDPIGTQPKGPFGKGHIDIGTPKFDIPGVDLPIERGQIATPNVPWPGFLTGPGPAFELLGDLAQSVAALRYGDGAAAADHLASGFSQINPFSGNASWLKRLRPMWEAQRAPEGGFTWRDGDSTVRQWEKHPGAFAQGLAALGIEGDWIDRFDLWASAQLPASRETHSWVSSILEAESSRMRDTAARRAARTVEDMAWWDAKLQVATDPAEREVLQRQRDELGQEWFRQRIALGLPADADEARAELRSSLRSAERRSAIMHELPARLRVVAYAGSRRGQMNALTRALEDPYQLVTDANIRLLSEAIWPQGGLKGLLQDQSLPEAERLALAQALQHKLSGAPRDK